MYRKKSRVCNIVCLFINFAVIFLSLLLATAIRTLVLSPVITRAVFLKEYCILILVWGMAYLILDGFSHFFKRGKFEELVCSVKLNGFTFVGFLIVQYFLNLNFISRLVVGAFFLLNVVLIWLVNMLYRRFLLKVIKNRSNTNRCVLVVNSDKMEEVITTMLEHRDYAHTLVGYVVYDEDCTGASICEIPCVSSADGLIDYCTVNVVDEVFIYLNEIDEEKIRHMVEELSLMGITTFLNLREFDWDIGLNKVVDKIGFYTVMAFSDNIISTGQYFMKRALDIIGGLVGCIFGIIIGIFVAPAIIIEDGFPVIFKQKRVGRNGRVFNFYKFRSMYRDAEERKKALMSQNEMSGPMFKIENDPRITKVGKFIRKTSLDEFPQFFNILKGDMSLVGTRPPTLQEYEMYSPYHKKRLSFKPGLTGNWQVSGRSDITDFEEVVKLDVEYIENWTFKRDIHILFKTVKMVFLGKGAK